MVELQELSTSPEFGPLPRRVAEWIECASAHARSVDCFEYIPSCPELLYAFLKVIPGRRYCEWGSGLGIGVGLASMLGFEATGIEIDPGLAAQSSRLLSESGLTGRILQGSYLERAEPADVVFVYCWPGQMNEVRETFLATMKHGTWLLIADGAERFTPYFLYRGDG